MVFRKIKKLSLFVSAFILVAGYLAASTFIPPSNNAAAASEPMNGDVTEIVIDLSVDSICSNSSCVNPTSSTVPGAILHSNGGYYLQNSSGETAAIPSSLTVTVGADNNKTATIYIPDSSNSGHYKTNGKQSWGPAISSNGDYVEYTAYVAPYIDKNLDNNPDHVNCTGSLNSIDFSGSGVGSSGIVCKDLNPDNSPITVKGSISLAFIPATCPGSATDGPPAPGTSCPSATTGSTGGGKDTGAPDVASDTGYVAPAAACPSGETGTPPNCQTSGTGSTTPTCESSGWSLSWAFCGVINGITDAEQKLQGVVNTLLQTKPVQLNNSDPTHTYEIWSQFRIYGNIVLVIALLVIVFGEVVGGDIIDTYTAKKMLPRILVAAILINLSIYIVASLEDVFNILGKGIEAIISTPFQAANDWKISLSGGLSGIGLVGIIGAAGVLWKLGGEGIAMIGLTIGLPVLFAVIGIIVTLLIRYALLLFLIFVSPVAFALYCLPNTEQYFKKWWELLIKTLSVYPIVGIIFAMANVTAVVMGSLSKASGTANDPLYQAMSVVAIVIPLFLIPFAFKISGGAMGAIHGAISGAGKKAVEGIKGNPNDPRSLGRRVQSRLRMRRAETGLTGAAINTRFNPKYIRRGGRTMRREDLQARREADRVLFGGEYNEADAIFQAMKGSDNFLLAAVRPDLAQKNLDDVESKRQTALNDAQAARAAGNVDEAERLEADASGYATQASAWRQAMASGRLLHNAPATQLNAVQALSATGYQWEKGQQGYNDLAKTIANITGAQVVTAANGVDVVGATGAGAGAYANAMNNAQYGLRTAGRYDLAGINNGKGYDPLAGLGKADPYTLASRAKPESIEVKGDLMHEALEKAKAAAAAGDVATYNAEMKKAEVQRVELDTIQDAATGKNKDTASAQLASVARDADLDAWRNAVVGTRRARVNYDAASPDAATWSTEERARGWRVQDTNITNGQLARNDAQGGRRPNPAELDEP